MCMALTKTSREGIKLTGGGLRVMNELRDLQQVSDHGFKSEWESLSRIEYHSRSLFVEKY